MPIEDIPRIIERIKMAPPNRPISVFAVKKGRVRVLDAIYGNTLEALRRINAKKPYHPSHKCSTCGHIALFPAEEWLGDFHNGMPLKDIRAFLNKAVEI